MRGILSICLVLGQIMMAGVNAQQLVVNGGFETFSSLPTAYTQWYRCVSWNNVNLNTGSTVSYATPDYFNSGSVIGSGVSLQANYYGFQNPNTGNAIMGFIAKNSAQSNFREYISSQLSSPMVVGETYTVSFYLSNGAPFPSGHPNRRRYGHSSTGIAVRFSTSPLTQANREPIGGTPQLVIPGQPWSDDWVLYTFTYICTSPWQYLTIGNFQNDASTSTTLMDPNARSLSATSYYYIDDVSVEVGTPLPIELISFDAKYNGKEVDLDWTTASELNNDYFTIERTTDLLDWKVIEDVPAAGNSFSVLNYNSIDHKPVIGTSYYRLKQTDLDGSTSYSGIRPVVIDAMGQLNIYPNPTHDKVTVEADWEKIREYVIQDQLGRDVTSLAIVEPGSDQHRRVFDLTSLPKGVYVLSTGAISIKLIKL